MVCRTINQNIPVLPDCVPALYTLKLPHYPPALQAEMADCKKTSAECKKASVDQIGLIFFVFILLITKKMVNWLQIDYETVVLTAVLTAIEYLKATDNEDGLRDLAIQILEPRERPSSYEIYLATTCAKHAQVRYLTVCHLFFLNALFDNLIIIPRPCEKAVLIMVMTPGPSMKWESPWKPLSLSQVLRRSASPHHLKRRSEGDRPWNFFLCTQSAAYQVF